MMMVVDHISATQMQLFERCNAAWMFYKVWGIRGKPRAAATRGRVVHEAIAKNYRQKVQSETDLPEDEVLDFYVDTFREQSHDTWWQKGEDRFKPVDDGIRVLQRYHQDIAPVTRPVDVEQNFKMNLSWKEGDEDKSVLFKGILDLMAQDGLHEVKTTGQTPREPKPAHIRQLTAYWTGKESMEGKPPINGRFCYLVTLKQAKIVSFPFIPSASQKQFFLRQVPRVVQAIEAGNYYPNRGNYLCKKDWCFYWDLCHKEFHG